MCCKCFTCKNRDPVAIKAYLIGQFEAFEDCIKSLEGMGFERGSLAALDKATDPKEQINNFLAALYCDMDDCGCLISSPEFDDVKFKGDAERFNKKEDNKQLEFDF